MVLECQPAVHEHRQDDIGRLPGNISARKSWWRDANDRAWHVGKVNGLADRRWFTLEPLNPVAIADHCQWLPARLIIVRPACPANKSIEPQRFKVGSGYEMSVQVFRLAINHYCDMRVGVSEHACKGVVPMPKLLECRLGKAAPD